MGGGRARGWWEGGDGTDLDGSWCSVLDSS